MKDRSTLSGNPSNLSQLSNRASVCGASATAANEQRQLPTQKESGGSIFRAKMPVFDGRSRWQAYLLQFQTILFMYQCNDERVMVGKLVEALRDKALDYFQNLPAVVRMDRFFGSMQGYGDWRVVSVEQNMVQTSEQNYRRAPNWLMSL